MAHAGDAMMMLISRSVWDVLQRQALAEQTEPGTVLSKAISGYISAHGSDDAKSYLMALERESRRASR